MRSESILTEVVSASIGGAISASALYPLEVLKTKMQAESKKNVEGVERDKDSPQSSASEDSIDSSLVDVSPTRSISSGITNDILESEFNEKSLSLQEEQTTDLKDTSFVSYAQELYRSKGLSPFYAGIETSAFQSAIEKALYFFAYTSLKKVYSFLVSLSSSDRGGAIQMGTAANLILGCIAEWAHLPITLPIDCWTTKIQTSTGSAGPFAILQAMLSEKDGIKGMYKGIQAYTVLCLKPAIQYTVFEQIKTLIIARKRIFSNNNGRNTKVENLTSLEAFLLGMFARTVATIFVFPYLRAKVMLQSESNNFHANEKRACVSSTPNIPGMIKKMYRSGGIGEIFRGIGPELTRGIFSAALMMMVKEKISFLVNATISSD
mmetsp:Transcript_1735/g.2494  ORF Transcript_1735/g.2494 Transcript_1735/m.2494 type:complete len:378 (-) Transcript_1735:150-1283(-)|eukprot:CAMPEP_0184864570 /NCGR_PEP_ID=MMETSP0580-20130426/15429_1 /TAXON_ID=1118495 /ORGANISM="Dactyliosolen fragilissimus" /LENGTH=377 /DNA_ID=CAMNT_0027363425 /DNA_START=81 /DNA_END=1214 /DNA_ORIENTATION=+